MKLPYETTTHILKLLTSISEKLGEINAVSGKLKTKSIGIVKGSEVAHIAPPAENLHFLMKKNFFTKFCCTVFVGVL